MFFNKALKAMAEIRLGSTRTLAARQNYQVTPGVSSSRPELGTRPLSVVNEIHSYWQKNEQDPLKSLRRMVSSCQRAISTELDFEEKLYSTCKSGLSALLTAEKNLLDLACECHGVVFSFIVRNGEETYVRYLEAGVYKGFMAGKGLRMIKEHGNDTSNILPWCIYTEDDVIERMEHRKQRAARIGVKRTRTDAAKPKRNRSAQTYTTLLGTLQSNLSKLKQELEESGTGDANYECLGFFVSLICKDKSTSMKNNSFLHVCGEVEDYKESLEMLLREYRDVGSPSLLPSVSLADLCSHSNPQNLQEQFEFLGKISNYHWHVFPVGYRKDAKLSNPDTGISIFQHILYRPKEDGLTHLPTSLRNRLMHFLNNGEIAEADKLLRYRLLPETFAARPPLDDTSVGISRDELGPPAPPAKRRRAANVAKSSLVQHVPCDLQNMSSVEHGIYPKFRTQTIESGTLFWRLHTLVEDVLLMNDYNCATGEFKYCNYVHITRYPNAETGAPLLSCSCKTYSMIQTVANVEENTALIGTTCMHCRFFLEEIEPSYNDLFSRTLSDNTNVRRKLLQSLGSLNQGVVPLPGTVVGGKKFSVRAGHDDSDDVAFVHLSRDSKFISCLRGECRALQINHKSSEKLATLESGNELCGHLEAMRSSLEVWRSNDVEERNELDDENASHTDGEIASGIEDEEIAEEVDAGLDSNQPDMPEEVPVRDADGYKKNFDPFTCKWNFGGRSTHKPADKFSIKLAKCVRQRNQIVDQGSGSARNLRGYLHGPPLVPVVDRCTTCECGRGYVDDEHPIGLQPEYDFTTTLYTRICPVKCDVMKRTCLGRKCTLFYSGAQDCIHFWTTDTCAGDEIGWDFMRRVTISKMTFSAFCQDMTAVYRSPYLISAKFMSRSTFVDWFFSWAARLEIDFREQCVYCGENPKFLACDGTHVGLSFRNIKVVPIEKPDVQEQILPRHRRNARCFLFYKDGFSNENVRKARNTFQIICKSRLGSIVEARALDSPSEEDEQNLKACTPEPVRHVVEHFIDKALPPRVDHSFATIFSILATDVSVLAFVPYRFLDDLTRVCGPGGLMDIDSLRGYAPEMHALLRSAKGDEVSEEDARCLIRYLIDFVHDMHDEDVVRQETERIPNSYNPESGVAYYFTPSGDKVRSLPKYEVSDVKGVCKKNYPKVSQGGFSFMFLWFCPLHGHCYGYHLIPGAEGRKDPFSSLYSYLPEPPKEIFYDFACGLFEYSMMREPGMFKATRFWHDIFHGFTHKCPKVFKSSRISGMEIVDSEICEQFNSYIQCIKYTASHLNQSHFTFFMQFMIHQWNSKKKESFANKLQVALSGCD